MNLKKGQIYLLVLMLFVGTFAHAQNREVYAVLAGLKQNLNLNFPLSDSLCPLSISQTRSLKKSFSLSKSEIIEITKEIKRKKRLKLDTTLLDGARLIPASSVYGAYRFTDSASVSVIEKSKPFYILSNPLIFAVGQKAIVDVDLIGRGGYTYLLVKKNKKWMIETEIVRWVT